MRVYHIYILCSASGVLYTGVTNDLECRVISTKRNSFKDSHRGMT
jgi:predicted GIY-YIG superfamily endonuclease